VRVTNVTRLVRAQRSPAVAEGSEPRLQCNRGGARNADALATCFLRIAASTLACEETGPVRRRKQGSGAVAAALPSVAALTGMPCLWSTFAQTPVVRFDYAEVAE
jgi:hypothetical protein